MGIFLLFIRSDLINLVLDKHNRFADIQAALKRDNHQLQWSLFPVIPFRTESTCLKP